MPLSTAAAGQEAGAKVTTAAPATGAPAIDEDIVVTARRTRERAQEIPLAITAISGDNLQRQAVREIRDLSGSVPNLTVQAANSGAGAAVITIRGQNQTNILLTVDSSVGLYVDNINIPRQYGIRDSLVDIQRVEVLRGPQGTLYGRNTTGGAVSFYTKDPIDTLGASVQGSVGNYGAYGLTGIVNVPLGDTVAARFVASHQSHDGYGDAVLDADRDLLKQDSIFLRGKIKGDFGRLNVTLSGDYSNLKTGGFMRKIVALNPLVQTGATPVGGAATREVALELGLAPSAALLTPTNLAQAAAVLQSYVNRPGFYDNYGTSPHLGNAKTYGTALNAEYELSDALKFRSISGFHHVTSDFRSDNDATPFVISENHQLSRSDFYSQEVQLLGEGPRLSWVLGSFYSREDGYALEESTTLKVLNGNNLVTTRGDITNQSFAIFGQANYKLTDELIFTAGARYTKEKRKLVSRNFSASGCTLDVRVRDDGATCKGTFDASFSKPSWLASLNYKITPDVMVYGKVSRGFRGGGLNLRATGGNLALYGSFAPETVTEYEVGAKSEFLSRRLLLNLALFYDDYQNVQRNVTLLINGLPSTLVTNAAKASLPGIEGEMRFRATNQLVFTGSFGHIAPKYKNFVDLTGDRSSEPWPAPRWNYSLGANFIQPLSFGELSANIIWNWQDDLTITQTAPLAIRPFVTQKAYGLLNGSLNLKIDAWDADISIFGRNVAQKHYYTSSSAFEAVGFSPLDTGEPRTFGIQLTKRFGTVG